MLQKDDRTDVKQNVKASLRNQIIGNLATDLSLCGPSSQSCIQVSSQMSQKNTKIIQDKLPNIPTAFLVKDCVFGIETRCSF
ncbi:hypothetical protein VNO78_18372 [Psophocarpus tetragonolobus]|uniref:Uncharacterized protein n=1 Tax=Psophocarpus tetragonolobus TaxID=3891 RepID=A0AAN9SJ76_PSOTE